MPHAHRALFEGQLKKKGRAEAYEIPLLVPFALFDRGLRALREKQALEAVLSDPAHPHVARLIRTAQDADHLYLCMHAVLAAASATVTLRQLQRAHAGRRLPGGAVANPFLSTSCWAARGLREGID